MIKLALALMMAASVLTSSGSESPLTTVEKRYPDGALMFVRTYRAGKEEGIHRGWWPSGSLKFEYRYHNGVSEGVQREWFDNKRVVGVTAGASAPEVLVERVVARLKEWGGQSPENLQGQIENVVFSLPRELRVPMPTPRSTT